MINIDIICYVILGLVCYSAIGVTIGVVLVKIFNETEFNGALSAMICFWPLTLISLVIFSLAALATELVKFISRKI